MSYTRVWDSATPAGTARANTVATQLRNIRVDLEERLISVFGLSNFTDDPIRVTTLNMGITGTAKILGGTTGWSVRNNANTADNLKTDDSGNVTVRGNLTISGTAGATTFNGAIAINSGFLVSVNSPLDVLGVQARIDRYSDGTLGATKTVDWDLSNTHEAILGANCVFTFSNPKRGAWYTLKLKQDATGNRTVTWPGTVLWPSGTAPALTTGANKTDFISFYYDGTNYFGFVGGLNY